MRKLLILIAVLCFEISQSQINNGKKILIVATSADNLLSKPNDHSWGAYAPEISDFFSMLYSQGFRAKDVDIVSPKGGPIPLAMPVHYPKKFHVSDDEKAALGNKMKQTLLPSEVKAEQYNVIYYSGGFSCLVDYPSSDSIAAIAAKIYENGGIVGAVCDGIAGLEPIKLSNQHYLVENKSVTTNDCKHKNDSVTKQLLAEGAKISAEKLVDDNRLITAHGVRPIAVATEVLRLLGYKDLK